MLAILLTLVSDVDVALALAKAKANQPAVRMVDQPVVRTYANAYHDAVRTNRPLVIFVDCKAPKYLVPPSYEWYEAGAGEWWDLTRTHERGVIISLDGYRRKFLPVEATADEINVEIFRAIAPVQPRQPIRSPTQIQWRSFDGGRIETLGRQPFQTQRTC